MHSLRGGLFVGVWRGGDILCVECARKELGFDSDWDLFCYLHTLAAWDDGYGFIIEDDLANIGHQHHGYGVYCKECGKTLAQAYCYLCGRKDGTLVPVPHGDDMYMLCSGCNENDSDW